MISLILLSFKDNSIYIPDYIILFPNHEEAYLLLQTLKINFIYLSIIFKKE